MKELNRRRFLAISVMAQVGAGYKASLAADVGGDKQINVKQSEKSMETKLEVTAVEDLMREHGVLRRILIVYSEAAGMLGEKPAGEISEPIHRAAQLFYNFGVKYHEKALEEEIIFPAISKSQSDAAKYVKTLIGQHTRGRQITEFMLAETKKAEPDGGQLAMAMEAMVRMYRSHAAREDTEVFPAWKKMLTREQFDEMGERFEEIEHSHFGEGGFEKAVAEIAAVEEELGIADLKIFTPRQWK